MEIIVQRLFVVHLKRCPNEFKQLFRHIYEKMEAAKTLKEVEGVEAYNNSKTHFKLEVDKSRIGIRLQGGKVVIVCFIFNQFIERE